MCIPILSLGHTHTLTSSSLYVSTQENLQYLASLQVQECELHNTPRVDSDGWMDGGRARNQSMTLPGR